MKCFLRNNGLSLALAAFFILSFTGHAWTGWRVHRETQIEHHQAVLAFGEYLRSGHFLEGVFENWESEFLQMAVYVVITACLFQKGSAESKNPGEKNSGASALKGTPPGPVLKGGFILRLYEHSLSLALAALFGFSWIGHLFAGLRLYNEENLQHGRAASTVGHYLASAEFWFESFQNWQSEFLSVLALVVLSIWLREKDSPESKEVAAPHGATGK